MISFLSSQQIKAARTNSEKRGVFNAALEVEPKNFIADRASLLPSDEKTYTVQAALERDNLLVSFSFNIPRGTAQGVSYINANPLEKTTTYAVMLSATSERINLYIGASGFVKFKYLAGERRIEGDFEYVCLLGKTFKGSFNVYED